MRILSSGLFIAILLSTVRCVAQDKAVNVTPEQLLATCIADGCVNKAYVTCVLQKNSLAERLLDKSKVHQHVVTELNRRLRERTGVLFVDNANSPAQAREWQRRHKAGETDYLFITVTLGDDPAIVGKNVSTQLSCTMNFVGFDPNQRLPLTVSQFSLNANFENASADNLADVLNRVIIAFSAEAIRKK